LYGAQQQALSEKQARQLVAEIEQWRVEAGDDGPMLSPDAPSVTEPQAEAPRDIEGRAHELGPAGAERVETLDSETPPDGIRPRKVPGDRAKAKPDRTLAAGTPFAPARVDPVRRAAPLLVGTAVLVGLAFFTLSAWVKAWNAERLADGQRRAYGRLLADALIVEGHARQLDQTEASMPTLADLDQSLWRQNRSRCDSRIIPRRELTPEGGLADPAMKSIYKSLTERLWDVAMPEDCVERPTEEGRPHRYYFAVRADRSCLVCHRSLPGSSATAPPDALLFEEAEPLKRGDLMGIVEITMPADFGEGW
jgi:hypothetical protein